MRERFFTSLTPSKFVCQHSRSAHRFALTMLTTGFLIDLELRIEETINHLTAEMAASGAEREAI